MHPGTTYRWDFGDGSISTAKNPTYTYFDPGTYRVELTVTGPGGQYRPNLRLSMHILHQGHTLRFHRAIVFVNDEKVR